MKTEIKYCPECERLYTGDDFCIDCAYDDDGTDSVELVSLGKHTPDELRRVNGLKSAVKKSIGFQRTLFNKIKEKGYSKNDGVSFSMALAENQVEEMERLIDKQ